MVNRLSIRSIITVLGTCIVFLFAGGANAAGTLVQAIEEGEVQLGFRLRYEDVDQAGANKPDADALTLRTRLGYQTASYHGFSAMLEMDNVTAADKDSYFSGSNSVNNKAQIADPTGTEVNQSWLAYAHGDTLLKYGRQRINLDNQRFVGGVGFRQNEQTFDALSISHKGFTDTEMLYARVNNVNRIFGEDSSSGDHDGETDIFHIKYSGWSHAVISAYAYLIDNEDANRFSTDTYGLRAIGKLDNEAVDFSYALEYARQEDAGNNSLKYQADYWLAEGAFTVAGVALKLGYESLGSDGGKAAVVTPLATLHKFQGWTDQFLKTPDQGVVDAYLSLDATVSGLKFLVVYHDFSSDVNNSVGDDNLGSEFGIKFAKRFNTKHLGAIDVGFKYASYDVGDASYSMLDTDKAWLTVAVSLQ